MTDDDLAKLGFSRFGDIVALRAFCRAQSKCNESQPRESETTDLLSRIQEKLGERGPARTGKSRKVLTGNKNAKKTTRRIEVGWLMQTNGNRKQIRSKTGGGTRHLEIEKSITVNEIKPLAMDLFFPNGSSLWGPLDKFNCSMSNFDGQAIDDGSVTVEELYEQTKHRIVRLYLKTVNKAEDEETFVAVASSPSCSEPEFEMQADVPDLPSTSSENTQNSPPKYHSIDQFEFPSVSENASQFEEIDEMVFKLAVEQSLEDSGVDRTQMSAQSGSGADSFVQATDIEETNQWVYSL